MINETIPAEGETIPAEGEKTGHDLFLDMDIQTVGGLKLIAIQNNVRTLPAVQAHLWRLENEKKAWQKMGRKNLMSSSAWVGAVGAVGCLLTLCGCPAIVLIVALGVT